jgi:hypothetical protein
LDLWIVFISVTALHSFLKSNHLNKY